MRKIYFGVLFLVGFVYTEVAFAQTAVKAAVTKPVAGSKKLTEAQKIDHLIGYIRNLNGAVFIRNGSEYSAQDAAEHLQMKRKKAGSRLKTANDFINELASESYLSGKPYQVRLKDGKTYSSRELLRQELLRLEKN